MADEKLPGPGGDDEWLSVTSGYQRGDAHKEGLIVTVSKKGLVSAGVEPTALVEQISRERSLPRKQYVLDFKASLKKGQVGCIPIPIDQATKATGAVRWYEGAGSPRASWHIGGVFKDFPELAPTGKVKCHVTRGTAPDGMPMLIIAVKAGLSENTSSRTNSQATPGSQTAASEND